MSQTNAFANPFAGLPQPGLTFKSPLEMENERFQQGYRPTASGYGGSVSPGANFQPSPFTSYTPTFLDQLEAGLGNDLTKQQAAADRQRNLLNAQISALSGTVGSISDRIHTAAGQSLGQIAGLIGDDKALAKQQGTDFENAASGIMGAANAGVSRVEQGIDQSEASLGRVDNDIAGAYTRADQAVDSAASAVSGYSTGVAEQAVGATIAGMRASRQQDMQRIQAGINPDGSMMTGAQRQQAIREMDHDTNLSILQTASSMREQSQRVIAGLKDTLANVQLGAAGVHIQGANERLNANSQRLAGEQLRLGAEQFRAGVGTTLNAQRLQSQEGQRQLMQMVGGLTELMSQIRGSSELAAFQAEVSGRTDLYNMIQNNPESVISLVPGLLMLAQVASAPGGRGMEGFDLSKFGRAA